LERGARGVEDGRGQETGARNFKGLESGRSQRSSEQRSSGRLQDRSRQLRGVARTTLFSAHAARRRDGVSWLAPLLHQCDRSTASTVVIPAIIVPAERTTASHGRGSNACVSL